MLELRNLRRLRLERLLSQADLAERSGVAESTINRLEQGKEAARFVTVRKLGAALGVDPRQLLDTSAGETGKLEAEGRVAGHPETPAQQ